MIKLIEWLKSLFKKITLAELISKFEPELRAEILTVLNKYWNLGNATIIADGLAEAVVRVLPKNYRKYISTLLNELSGNFLEDVDFDGNVDDAADYIISKLKSL